MMGSLSKRGAFRELIPYRPSLRVAVCLECKREATAAA
jgi:hypothetical protein